MKTVFQRLVRFRDETGTVRYGEAPEGPHLVGQTVLIYEGENPWHLQATASQTTVIAEVLCPLPQVPIIYGVGLNYKTHITEAGFPVPSFPTIFTKPPDALTGPYADILVDKQCQNMDYEGELAVIIGRDAKNIQAADVAEYILGYTVGNDVSCRYWQMPDRAGNQHGYAKSFDGFAPIGPVIVSTKIANPDDMDLTTHVNGQVRQHAKVNDLLFKVGDIIEHLSRGTTLRAGTVIMTGTPDGVAAFIKPPAWLADGDVVEVSISGIGTIRNKYRI